MNPAGVWVVRRRSKLPVLGHDADAMVVERILGSMLGLPKLAADATRQQASVVDDITATD